MDRFSAEEFENKVLRDIINIIEDEYDFAKFAYEDWIRRKENMIKDSILRENCALWAAGRLAAMEDLVERINRMR